MPKQSVLSPQFKTEFQREVSFLEIPEFPFDTVWDRWKEVPMPKTSSIRSSVSKELRLGTDTDRHGHGAIASTRANIESSG